MIESLQIGVHNALWFFLAIAVMVAFHEFGHFWVARRFGVKVLRFSVGFSFGPFKPLWKGRGRDGVEYQIGSIPLGGYVKLLDEREGPVAEAALPRAFNRQPVWVRIAVFAAGPLFNVVLAVVFFWLMLMVGVPDMKPVADAPPAGSAAAVAGLHRGDLVVRFNDAPVHTWGELTSRLVKSVLTRQPVTVTVRDAAGGEHQLPLNLERVRTDPQFLGEDLGFIPFQPPIPAVVGAVVPDSPAQRAGLQPGDTVTAVDGKPVAHFQDLQPALAGRGGQQIRLQVQRGAGSLELTVVPTQLISQGQIYVGIGVRPPQHIAADDKMWQDLRIKQQYGPLEALPAALQLTWDTAVMVAEFVYHMVLGDISVRNISGPINTAQVVGASASIGLWDLLRVVAIVSLNLGIVNLLPVPLLDGGQILFGLAEWIKGSPLSERAQMYGQQVGLTLLVLLMGLAFYNDLSRLLG